MQKSKKRYYLLAAGVVVVAGVLYCMLGEMRIPCCWLPSGAKTFVATYFPDADCVYAEREWEDGRREFEVKFSDGTDIEFRASGEWKKVDCGYSFLPAGIVPQAIVEDLAVRYPGSTIYKIERERGGYEITIGNGMELIYASDGTFVRADAY